MKKELKIINLEYNENDKLYIDNLTKLLDESSLEILSFFELSNIKEKINVKLFDNLDEFRKFHQDFFHKENPSSYVTGFSFKNNVYTLSLKEYQKAKKNDNINVEDLSKLIIHEVIHSIHNQIHDNRIMLWFTEGLATILSHQYDESQKKFDITYEELITGKCSYNYYYTMFSYVLENYGKEYILYLLNNEEELKEKTKELYEETYNFYTKRI